MATAEINDLFEEGITRCRELSDEADEAMNAIDRMAEQAEALTRRVEEEGEEACRRLRELTHDIQEAGAELESSTSDAVEALAGFDGAVDGIRGALDDLLARAESAVAELTARKDDVERTVDAQMDSARDAFQELAKATGEAGSDMEHQARATAGAIVEFARAVDGERREMAQKLEDWATAGQALTTAAQEAATAWTASLSGLLDRQATALVEAGNAIVDKHNEAMAAIEQRFVDQAPFEVELTMNSLVDGLGEIGEQAIDIQKEFASSAHAEEFRADAATVSLGQAQGRLEALAGLA